MHSLEEMCACGSQKAYGACCGSEEMCNCGSGETAGNCCFADTTSEASNEDNDAAPYHDTDDDTSWLDE